MNTETELSKTLRAVVEQRRTVREFKPDIPSKEAINEIVHAGLWAPYAGLAITKEKDFRRFFIIQNGNTIMNSINELIKEQSKVSLAQMEKTFSEKPFLKEKAKGYLNRVTTMAERGFDALLTAPCLIIVGEQKGIPPSEKQSLAHVIQNMWLITTALGLGFRLISVIESLSENKDFCELLGVELGDYAFTGCIVGFALKEPEAGKRPREEEITKWL
jgi:nitroreductase